MLNLSNLDNDQTAAIDHCFEADNTLLIGVMGSGKSAIALTCIEELIVQGDLNRVLVLAPLKVCNKTWRGEAQLWEHLKGLRVGIATGDDRDDVFARFEDYDVIVSNFDILPALASMDVFKHFDGLVVDEATALAEGGAHFKALRHSVKDFKWRLVMAGLPLSEGYHKAFYIQYLVDAGAVFGKNKQKWLDKWCYPTDFKRYKWAVKPGQEPKLAAMLAPTTHVIPDYRDSLPPLTVELVACPLPPVGWKHYKEMAGKMKTAGVSAKTAGVKSNKLTQLANGFIYGVPLKKSSPKPIIRVHNSKDEKLAEIFSRSTRSSILIVYQFTAELEMLRARYPDLAILADDENYIDEWQAGRLNALAMHPRSGGHGTNLQNGGHELLWLSPPWSRDMLDQMNARLHRRGQKHPVRARILFAPDTIDQVIWDRQGEKAAFMPAFLEHLKNVALESP